MVNHVRPFSARSMFVAQSNHSFGWLLLFSECKLLFVPSYSVVTPTLFRWSTLPSSPCQEWPRSTPEQNGFARKSDPESLNIPLARRRIPLLPLLLIRFLTPTKKGGEDASDAENASLLSAAGNGVLRTRRRRRRRIHLTPGARDRLVLIN
jgi:hypothetical protein